LARTHGVEFGGTDTVVRFDVVSPTMAGHVEKNGTAGDPLDVDAVDAVPRRTEAGHCRRRHAVVQELVVPDVRQRIPRRRRLERHDDHVVGEASPGLVVRREHVVHRPGTVPASEGVAQRGGVAAVNGHQMNRIAAEEVPGPYAIRLEVDPSGKILPVLARLAAWRTLSGVMKFKVPS
jgi:hypothetical protein